MGAGGGGAGVRGRARRPAGYVPPLAGRRGDTRRDSSIGSQFRERAGAELRNRRRQRNRIGIDLTTSDFGTTRISRDSPAGRHPALAALTAPAPVAGNRCRGKTNRRIHSEPLSTGPDC
ncbi:hypothetical protein EVAR_40090_1 [Eumeta japonica]|uniref:Uncharacterized protein n=1 Tax=Eumeta variegata TaxID=151549 RepID=A0A4C1X1K7_EUMVA|nr:hypothetical protein EVAR_40090_1 [Eumeta japonica]